MTPGKAFDLWDLGAGVALGAIGYGLWLVFPPLTYIVLGVVIFLLCMWGSRRPLREGP